MGAGHSRNRVDISNTQIGSNHPYTYPPPTGGDYFTSHYHLGSKKFETADPEKFLFGDISDVNYLTQSPAPFPYKQPPKKRPVECLNSLLFLYKETVKLVRSESNSQDYSIEFIFDSDSTCNISVFQSLPNTANMETLAMNRSTTSDVTKMSTCYTYENGLDQTFSESTLTITPSEWEEERLTYNVESEEPMYPVAILMEVVPSQGHKYQSLLTICNIDKTGEDSYSIKVLKQKLLVDEREYILHEIFGLENKAVPKPDKEDSESTTDSEDDDDLGAECVICFTDVKDTLLLPCRHYCLCASCAADLRYQASNCPICRAPFQALLQIQAIQPISPDETPPDDDEITNNPELYSVPGHKLMSLLQALNGYPKLHKNACCNISVEAVLSADEEQEEVGDVEDATGQTVITIDSNSIEDFSTAIPMDDELSYAVKTKLSLTTTTLEEGGKVLPDVIPLGSIPGTPDNYDTDFNSGKIMVTAAIEFSSDRSRTSSTSERSNDSQELLIRKDSNSTPTTELSSIPSSRSFDSSNSKEALLLKTGNKNNDVFVTTTSL